MLTSIQNQSLGQSQQSNFHKLLIIRIPSDVLNFFKGNLYYLFHLSHALKPKIQQDILVIAKVLPWPVTKKSRPILSSKTMVYNMFNMPSQQHKIDHFYNILDVLSLANGRLTTFGAR